MNYRTPLYAAHLAFGAKMVEFCGWDMPIHYGSQVDEHHAVRQGAGMFDVSHMGIVDLRGSRVRDMLRYILANDVAKLDDTPGRALYSCMLDQSGGVLDDLIVQYAGDLWYRVVINAATKEKDIAWLRKQAESFRVKVEVRDDLAMIAVQGPEARHKVHQVDARLAEMGANLHRFEADSELNRTLSRTGYTGEDGYEIMLPKEDIEGLWLDLHGVGVLPCGLGARDTLRLEAGMSLYGHEMDEDTTPWVSALGWTVALEPQSRQFIGRQALEAQRQQGITQRLVGLVLEGRGVLRAQQRVVVEGVGEGITTSGSFSPTMGEGIALARIPVGDATRCQVEIRGKLLPARIVRPPFVRDGKVLV